MAASSWCPAFPKPEATFSMSFEYSSQPWLQCRTWASAPAWYKFTLYTKSPEPKVGGAEPPTCLPRLGWPPSSSLIPQPTHRPGIVPQKVFKCGSSLLDICLNMSITSINFTYSLACSCFLSTASSSTIEFICNYDREQPAATYLQMKPVEFQKSPVEATSRLQEFYRPF